MPNCLVHATSPYLLQHQDNPVDWWERGDEAFAEARRRDVPVPVSIGWAARHWCHVMI
ncbi:MAG: thioredoxin domain-containing protein [Spirochaetaceae bacterium]|nr:thioredoxin domain-containing protein [Spirochaetaceae bacterium]